MGSLINFFFLQSSVVDMDSEGIDEDVLTEDRQLGQEFPPDSPVVIYRLRKEVRYS